MTTPSLSRVATGFVLGLFLASGAACDRDSPGRTAVRGAGERLQALAAEGMRISAGDADRRKGFESVLQAVKPYRDGDGNESAAANLLAARALAGIADIDAAVAAEGERRALDRAVAVRASLNLYTGQTAMAGASVFDPAGPLAEIDRKLQEIDQAVAKAAADSTAAARQRDDLLARAKAALDRSKGLREQSGALRRQAADATAVRGLELTEQSVALSRQADELDRQAAYLQADADALAPVIAELKRSADALAQEKSATQARRAEVVKRAESARATVAEATAAAGTAAAAISRQVTELAAHRAGDMDAAATRAANGYRDALAAAKKALASAKGADRAGAQIVVGSIQQSSAHLAATQWRGRQAYAALLTLLAGAQPPMDGAAKFSEDAKTALAAADEALASAKQQYQDAIDTLSNVQGTSEEVKARVERIKQILTDLNAGRYEGVPAAAPATPTPATPAPASGGDSAASAPAGDAQAVIKSLLDKYHEAARNKDFQASLALVHISNPQQGELMRDLAAAGMSGLELDAACQAKFGKGFGEIISAGPMAQMGAGLAMMTKQAEADMKRTSADYEIAVTGPTQATATLKDPGPLDQPHEFGVHQGKWMFQMNPERLAGVEAMAPLLKPLAGVFSTLAADVNSGKISTEQMLNAAVLQRLAPVMQRMQGGGNMPQPGGG